MFVEFTTLTTTSVVSTTTTPGTTAVTTGKKDENEWVCEYVFYKYFNVQQQCNFKSQLDELDQYINTST